MGLDLGGLQSVMSKINSTTLQTAMTAYFNGSANATQAFAMLDPAAAKAITDMLNGTDLSSFIGMTSAPTANHTGGTATTLPFTPVKIPPLPRAGIFDAPMNPYLNGLDKGNSTLSAIMSGLRPEAQNQAQVVLVNEMVKAAKEKAAEISTLLIFAFSFVLLFNVVLLIHIRYNRRLAAKGDSTAARKIVLPAFEPLLWAYTVTLVGYITFWATTIHADFMTVQSTYVTIEMLYGCKQTIVLLVPIYMMQKSLSVPALIRAIAITIVASFYTVPIVWVMQEFGRSDQASQRLYYWIVWVSRLLTFIPFLYVCLWPPARSSVQAFREYFVFYIIGQVLSFAATEVIHRGGSFDLGLKFSYATGVFLGLCPYVIWRVLKADTEHWRGMGKRAVELQTRFRRKGKIEERISAKGLHVLIELHRKYIIDFASLDIQHKISETEHAMVFRGKFTTKQAPVAIKVYTPENFDEDTVAEFSHEAALCGALQHPNILKFYGMCVCPPTICLVTELCQGSLRDITKTMAKKTAENAHRQQFLINIGYMIDAARAVAYMHSFSPAFVHRDIHPGSFLVDSDGSVKLTDFGASRTLSLRSASSHQHQPEHEIAMQAAVDNSTKKTVLSALAEIVRNLPSHHPEYMAPEVIRSKNAGTSKYGEAADIYALAMTMWDILYPNESKYNSTVRTVTSTNDSTRRESEVFDCVFAGQRPFLDERMFPPLRDLLQMAWHSDPRMRPSAQSIVNLLETIQEESCAVYALELVDALECVANKAVGVANESNRSFPGSRAIEKMYALQHVGAESEAIRLGNMLMDAGYLHHIKHIRSFEYSAALYFFDEDSIQQNQPLAMLEDGVSQTNARSRRVPSARGNQRLVPIGRKVSHVSSELGSDAFIDHPTVIACACRKLGQKSETTHTTRSRLRFKFKSSDEHLVTARLLADEPNVDFEAFQDQQTR